MRILLVVGGSCTKLKAIDDVAGNEESTLWELVKLE
jgi:hypothetical protein